MLFPQLRTRHSSRYYRLSKVSFWWQIQCVLLVADEGCPSGGICCGTSRGYMRVALSGADVWSPPGDRCMMSLRGADTIELHEIHLARQSSLQVPVGHIPVPGGIKLCSPGTFWVANYLIINNGSCQVNFTKHAVGWSSCRKIYQQGSQQDKVIGLPVYWKAELR